MQISNQIDQSRLKNIKIKFEPIDVIENLIPF